MNCRMPPDAAIEAMLWSSGCVSAPAIFFLDRRGRPTARGVVQAVGQAGKVGKVVDLQVRSALGRGIGVHASHKKGREQLFGIHGGVLMVQVREGGDAKEGQKKKRRKRKRKKKGREKEKRKQKK